jgi:hypothetical protein
MDLKNLFIQNFNMDLIALDLMDLIDDDKLEEFMFEKFKENFMYGELYDIFKDYLDKETLQCLLEDMGFDFVDLDELDEEEREKYY